jgi:hypothetical protein
LVTNKVIDLPSTGTLAERELRYIKKVLSSEILQKEKIITKRLDNYSYLKDNLAITDFEERFVLTPGEVPGVFMFKVKNESIDLAGLKQYCYAHGIQCSVFYGESSFFIPVHQNLEQTDLDYFIAVINSFVRVA